jgi:undecaprenyl-diphosphatase
VDISALGGYAVLTLMILSVVGYLMLARRFHALVLVLAATLGGWGLSTALKDLFGRPRPSIVPHLTHVGSASFPSGHAMLSAIIYLTLGALLARLVARRSLKLYFILVAVIVSLLVGSTRIYLGVHYPSDVLAGWAAGLVWAVACWLAARYLQHKGAVEQSLSLGGAAHGKATSGGGDGS